MKEYNYLQAIFMSFYSRRLYRDVADNWGAGVVLYLFFLLAICWAIMMLKFQPAINVVATQLANKFVMQLPEMAIKNGEITTKENRPYLISNEKKTAFAIIDTSGRYTTLESAPQNTKILVTKDMLYYYDDNNNLKMQKIPQKFNLNFEPAKGKEFIEHFAKWLWMIIFPIFLIISFIYRLVQALVYAVIGKIFAALANVPLSYSKILKLTMIAITPAIIIGDVLNWLEITFNLQWLLLFVISMIYLIFAIKANKHTEMIVT